MEIRLAGELTNVAEAVREVQQIYADAPLLSFEAGQITEGMRTYMAQLLTQGNSRALFLWLLKLTFDITAPEQWWHQGEAYFSEIRWVRKHPREEGEGLYLSQDDFEGGVPAMVLQTLNDQITEGRRELLEATLPENFIRRGYAQTDYAALRRLYEERGHYNAGHWQELAKFLTALPYAEFITGSYHRE